MALSKLAARRLTKLAGFMDALPPEAEKHFFMGAWVRHEGDNHHGFERGHILTQRDILTCGTTACAAGWATAVPEFKEAGLRLVFDGTSRGDVEYAEESAACGGALHSFFDIDDDAVEFLFDSGHETILTPKAWAKRCRKFIRKNSK
jgi:hypothetical protein